MENNNLINKSDNKVCRGSNSSVNSLKSFRSLNLLSSIRKAVRKKPKSLDKQEQVQEANTSNSNSSIMAGESVEEIKFTEMLDDQNNGSVESQIVIYDSIPCHFYQTMGIQVNPFINPLIQTHKTISPRTSLKNDPIVFIQKTKCTNEANALSLSHETYQKIQELSIKLRESENSFIFILKKYITDPSIQADLMAVVSKHSKIYADSETTTSTTLTNIWMKQLETERIQGRALQETLNVVVKQNRQLQLDNETLFRNHERAISRLHAIHSQNTGEDIKCGLEKQIEHFMRHNERLQQKLVVYYQQLGKYENEMHLSKIHYENLEKEFFSVNEENQLLKAKLDRSKNEYDLEVTSLNTRLENSDQILRDIAVVGKKVIEELITIKSKISNIPNKINWNKLTVESSGTNSIEILNICNDFVTELSNELLTIQENVSFKELEVKHFDSNIGNEETTSYENQLNALRQECELYQEEIIKNKLEFESIISLKEKILEEKLQIINNIHRENHTLQAQVENLEKIIKEIGCGDANYKKDPAIQFQTEFNQILKEKQQLVEKYAQAKDSNRILLENHHQAEQQLNNQKVESHTLKMEVEQLKVKYEAEHQTTLSLQKERKKYLEEKAELKQIFQRMKSDIDRMEKLEEKMLNASNEANRLALIADFNKQIGEKLKEEVIERDNTISLLRGNMDKLNYIQVENTKEKLSLCHELSEVCTIKEQLSTVLSTEVQRNYALCEANKDLESTATDQVKQYQEKFLTERETLKELFKELKSVVQERDNLLIVQNRYLKEIKDLQSNFLDLKKKLSTLIEKSNKKDVKIHRLTESLKNHQDVSKETELKLTKDLIYYKESISSIEAQLRKTKQEKDDLQNSIEYLQNTTQKLHKDLNDSRKSEKDMKMELDKVKLEFKKIDNQNIEHEKTINKLCVEKEKLKSEIDYVNNLCEKVLSDFESSIKINANKEDTFKKECENYKTIILRYEADTNKLQQELKKAQAHLDFMKTNGNSELTAKYLRTIEELKEENHQQKKDFLITEQKLKNMIEELNSKISHKTELHRRLKGNFDEQKIENKNCKQNIEKLKREHKVAIECLEQEVTTLNKKVQELSAALENLRSIKDTAPKINEVSENTCELVQKKKSLQNIVNQLNNTQNSLHDIELQKQILKCNIEEAMKKLETEKKRIEELTKEKETVEKLRFDVSSKCSQLQNEIRESTDHSRSDFDTLRQNEMRTRAMKRELDQSYEIMINLKDEISKFEQQITQLEFQRCELTLRLHESQGHCETEKAICDKLRKINQNILSTIVKMKDEGKVGTSEFNELMMAVQEESCEIYRRDSNLTTITNRSEYELSNALDQNSSKIYKNSQLLH
ncbi:polyamine-modulated factor 1-binding protein 1 isoform X2 [Aethina tumida]|uniref:polyamine-modulated factor 1-binding protein 1 isoform X2 n=1 Tax=Aethina tumida TaxID=116153 RepID=UPI0021498242|nr:polyamine-modulated factor 1-binding protein 1 isoform X2 [Aethina tumida]